MHSEPAESMKKPTFFMIVVFFIIVALTIVQVVISNSLATAGIELSSLDKQIKSLKVKNALLREEYLVASSLHSIASRASELGFIEEKSRVFLSNQIPIAINHDR